MSAPLPTWDGTRWVPAGEAALERHMAFVASLPRSITDSLAPEDSRRTLVGRVVRWARWHGYSPRGGHVTVGGATRHPTREVIVDGALCVLAAQRAALEATAMMRQYRRCP